MNTINFDRILADAKAIAIDVSATDGDASRIVIFDRTGLTDDDGEWGTEITAFDGDFVDVEVALEEAGFDVAWHSNYRFGNETGELYTGTRYAEVIETPTPSPEMREEIEAVFAAWGSALALLSEIEDAEQHVYLAEQLHGARQALDRALYRTLDDDFDAGYFVSDARDRVKLAINLFATPNR